MIFVIIEMQPRMRFNPFVPQIDIFSLYQETKFHERESRSSFISYHNFNQVNERINHLAFKRFLLLEMLVDNYYQIPRTRNEFLGSINRASFHMGSFQQELPHRASAAATRSPVQFDQEAASPRPTVVPTPFSHIPAPDAAKKKAAQDMASKLGDDLPTECNDPITMMPLLDPIEINKRVYNRDTASNLIKNGKFQDPFTRETIDPTTAKSADYMLDAIVQHDEVKQGKKPALLDSHKNTDVHPLKDLLQVWEDLLSKQSQTMIHS
ncbi:Uncharacterised protein [Legionella lansingensis]|uniref:U-box domain-containing protein n=1 Tax=Legionella lansingensis TaxID=45067 RepID=A0A0W0VEH4_9GAMM|nr:hypothetical protein [Legionella lansingensis]KTD18531.1 hypothetical protein Llan_2518 [Legionella lansingensis]SNV50956.1 Uncharacterised protein [Legionella lansingensis]